MSKRSPVQFPSFPLLGDGELGNYRQLIESAPLPVSQQVFGAYEN